MNSAMLNSLIVSYSFSGKDEGVLIVGQKNERMDIEIINAFQGKEAREIHKLLTTKKRPAGDPHVD